MDRFDFSPLFRSTTGFDRLTRLADAAARVDSASLTYPPYNIDKDRRRRLSADDGGGRFFRG
jgi:molecular chaperone IbpA